MVVLVGGALAVAALLATLVWLSSSGDTDLDCAQVRVESPGVVVSTFEGGVWVDHPITNGPSTFITQCGPGEE
jgi:hypothetical protein